MGSLRKWARHAPHSPFKNRAHLSLEPLESRIVPYNTTGNAWPSPQLVTISFVPDGTNLGGQSSNLFATLNAKWSQSTWENIILKAAQEWAQQTNVNFSLVSDNGTGGGGGSYQQGDPGMGDVRIGGYNLGTPYGQAFYPAPVNNFSISGDIDLNTAVGWHINGSAVDLQTVAVHEFGHALGLAHSSQSSAVMYGTYNGTKRTLTSDDTAGIRNIYSSNNPRSADQYDAGANPNNTIGAAADITSLINTTTMTAVASGLDITNAGETDYFIFTTPSGVNSTITVKAQSSGLSLLAPTLTVYNSSQQQIGSVSGAGQYGTTLSLSISGVSAGQQYYVEVAGADTSPFGTGAYAITLNLGTGSGPTVPLPNTQLLNGSPLHSGGGTPESPAGSTDDTGRDTFGAPTNTVTTTSVSSTVFSFTLSNRSQNPAAVSAVVTLPTLPTAPAASAPLATVLGAPAGSVATIRSESGGGDNRVSDNQQPPEQLPLPKEYVAPPPAPAPADQDTPPASAESQAALWRAACTACFESESTTDGSMALEQNTAPALAVPDTGTAAVDPAAATAALAVVLGGYWGSQPEDLRLRRSRSRKR